MSATTSSDLIDRRFAAMREAKRRALVVYVTAGHPDPAASLALLRGLPDAGADVVEVGVPFSDPMADGPIIQASSQRALENGIGLNESISLIEGAGIAVPVVLFSYLNPILAAGDGVLDRAAAAGVHGLLLTDLPVGADPPLEARIAAGPLAFIRLVAPTTPDDRMRSISGAGSGFVYLISRLGVTGVQDTLPPDLDRSVRRLRAATSLPVCVGFGVSRPEQAAAVSRVADGVVVGSAVVRAAEQSVDAALALVADLRAAIDQG